MKVINECHYCHSSEVGQMSIIHVDKKIMVNGRCANCLKSWTETWTLTKIQKNNLGNKMREEQEKDKDRVLTAT